MVGLFLVCSLMAAGTARSADGSADTQRPQAVHEASASVVDYFAMYRSHRVGNIGFTLSNFGQFGNSRRLGCCDWCTREPSESFEFPIRSGIDYLGTGSLWIGAIRGTDTLVSIGTDGWGARTEFFPRPGAMGAIIERTIRPVLKGEPALSRCTDVYFSGDAVSEQDLIAYYYDTVTSRRFVWPDLFDGREHIPLGVEVVQKSYAWSFDYARNFILVDLDIRNVGDQTLNQMYIGIFMDFDVGHHRLTFGPNWDDITGFIHTIPSPIVPGALDTVNIAWTADNDGDPGVGRFESISATGVAGVRVLKAPSPDLKFSFNWWASNPVVWRDWGPVRRTSPVVFKRGNLGTPLGDVARYQMMANGEFDYDQLEAALDHQADGWLPPVKDRQLATDLADGYDTRFLLSFGPFELPEDSTLSMAIAFVAGADLHTSARNFGRYFDPGRPELFQGQLDFSDLVRSAQWAGWVYDTPGFDTDGDGYRGRFRVRDRDTIYYTGDGVPDFRGPPPPPSPELRFKTSEGRIVMRWNGEKTENSIDYFSGLVDFEGYRVYMSRTGLPEEFALLTQRDRINYIAYKYNPSWDRWVLQGRPLTLDSLRTLFDDLVDSVYNFRPFHPDSFKVRLVERALREIVWSDVEHSRLDTNYYYFEKFDANDQVNDTTAATLADCCASDVTGVIRKRFPFATRADTVYEEGKAYPAFYEYEYAIDGLQVAEPVYLSVTAFDFGDPVVGLKSLESSPLANAEAVWPINASRVVDSLRPKPGVYPNPYRLADDYNGNAWEDPRQEGLDPERARKVTFTNVPDTCTITIWSLDGDLVRRLEHRADPASSEATVVVWNLITRNTQAVKTGIYIYAIESRFGTDIGKLVIIK